MAPNEDVVVNATCVIPADELTWRFSASGGPGGQHANTSNTRVELVFNIASSRALNDFQRQRLLDRFGDEIRVVASDERSQSRNRDLAHGRLAQSLREALVIQRTRRPTRPTRASKERRLQSKQTQSDRKQQRRPPSVDD